MRNKIQKMRKYATLVREVATQKGDERASKCGYDLFCGLATGNAEKRYDAWIRFLKEKDDHTDSNRDGVWVPAIPL